MAKIVVYDSSDVNVSNRVTGYYPSGHSPDFSGTEHLVNPPGLGFLVGNVDQKYWKEDSGDVVEMSQAEKDIVDSLEGSNKGYGESEDKSGSASDQYNVKLVVTKTLISETYDVQYYCEVKNSNPNTVVQLEVKIGNEVIAEPCVQARKGDCWLPVSGFKEMALAGQVTGTISYKKLEGRGSTFIRRARLKIS